MDFYNFIVSQKINPSAKNFIRSSIIETLKCLKYDSDDVLRILNVEYPGLIAWYTNSIYYTRLGIIKDDQLIPYEFFPTLIYAEKVLEKIMKNGKMDQPIFNYIMHLIKIPQIISRGLKIGTDKQILESWRRNYLEFNKGSSKPIQGAWGQEVSTLITGRGQRKAQGVLKLIGNKKIDTLLDIGGGNGEISYAVGQKLGAKNIMIYDVQDYRSKIYHPHTKFIDSLKKIPNRSIDVILVMMVLHHSVEKNSNEEKISTPNSKKISRGNDKNLTRDSKGISRSTKILEKIDQSPRTPVRPKIKFSSENENQLLSVINPIHDLLNEIFRILKKDGMVFLREHDCQSEYQVASIDLEHLVYDVVLEGKSYDETIKDYKAMYASKKTWDDLFTYHGFTRTKVTDTIEPMMYFEAVYRV